MEAFPNRPFESLKVLDVGCGNGSELTLSIGKLGFNVVGIDTHLPSIEHAQLLAKDVPHARFACAQVEELHDSYYDVVILSEVLEHQTQPQKLLKASINRMSDKGLLIVTVPNGYGEFEIDSYVFKRLRLQRVIDRFAKEQTSTNRCNGQS
jgi:2-polyprenyl-3-methyl-5-hydroxy-6-metoxy-1,4-benzoquinol methylase